MKDANMKNANVKDTNVKDTNVKDTNVKETVKPASSDEKMEIFSRFSHITRAIESSKNQLDCHYGEMLKQIETLQDALECIPQTCAGPVTQTTTVRPSLTSLKDVPMYDPEYKGGAGKDPELPLKGVKFFINRHSRQHCGERDIAAFKEKLRLNYEVVYNFDFAKEGLVIAGGFVTSLLGSTPRLKSSPHIARQDEFGDVDFYMVKPSSVCTSPEERACDAARGLSEYLKKCRDSGQVKNLRKFRTSGSVTFLFDWCIAPRLPAKNMQFQIILREYSSVEKVIGTFDIGACSVAYTGDDVVFTAQAVEEHRSGCITYNPNANETTVRRVEKYMTRGWGLHFMDFSDEHVADVVCSGNRRLAKNIYLVGSPPFKDDGYWHATGSGRLLAITTELTEDCRAEGDDYILQGPIDYTRVSPRTNAISIIYGKTGYCAEAPSIDTPLSKIDLDYSKVNLEILKIAMGYPLCDLAENINHAYENNVKDRVAGFLEDPEFLSTSQIKWYLLGREKKHTIPFAVKGDMVENL